MPVPVLTVAGVSKSYSGVRAVDDVSLELFPGEVHALIGENGAGKSTLSRVLAGLVKPDAGRMTLDAKPFSPASRAKAERAGVRIVMQELNLIPTLSVAENIYLDRLPRRLGFVRYGSLHAAAAQVLDQIGMNDLDPARPMGTLGIGIQQMVEIARGLAAQCRVLILDEPTASLARREIDRLFENIRRLKSEGVAIVYISHRMEEIQQIADRLTVMRDGRHVITCATASVTPAQIIRHMVGRDVGEIQRPPSACGQVALRVRNLAAGDAVRGVSFDLHRGEILGLAGLVGSGRTETLRAIFGADRRDGGMIQLFDVQRPAVLRSPHAAVRQGLAFLTEDRKGQGLLLQRSIMENITITGLPRLSRVGFIRRPAERAVTESLAARLDLRARSVAQSVGELSGGNQQKVVIAKWLLRDSDILLVDEPTRGIDVGAKFEIYRLLGNLVDAGKAVLVVSSDMLELFALCDRIAVMSAGHIAETFTREQFDQEAIMTAALSGYSHARS